MEYISNAFSPNMVGNNTITFEIISKKEFVEKTKTAKSVVGHPEIAEKFNLELNRVSITLNKDDVLYVVTPNQRQKSEKYEFNKNENEYIYRKITVIE